MWLSKDERRLLAGYFTQIGEVGTEKVYRVADLCELLTCCSHRKQIPEYGDPEKPKTDDADFKSFKAAVVGLVQSMKQVHHANKLLAERGMISVTPHETDHDVVLISLKLDGYDLGRRYSAFFDWSGLLFQEYKDHWMWLIFASFGGAIVLKLIDFVQSLFAG